MTPEVALKNDWVRLIIGALIMVALLVLAKIFL